MDTRTRPTFRLLALACLAALALLWALGAVVKQVVRQADARHAHSAASADATWRCGNLAGRVDRNSCRQRVSSVLIDAGDVNR